jgi:hypothetical protein
MTKSRTHLLDPQQLSSVISRAPQSSGRSAWLESQFQVPQTGHLFICTHNETFSVAAMCVSNPDRSAFAIHGGHAVPTPTGFAELSATTSQLFIRFRAIALMIMSMDFNCGFEFEKGRQTLDLHSQ